MAAWRTDQKVSAGVIAVLILVIILLLFGGLIVSALNPPTKTQGTGGPKTCTSGYGENATYLVYPSPSPTFAGWQSWTPSLLGGIFTVDVTAHNGTLPTLGPTNATFFAINVTIQRVDSNGLSCGAFMLTEKLSGALLSSYFAAPGGFFTHPNGGNSTLVGGFLDETPGFNASVGTNESFQVYPSPTPYGGCGQCLTVFTVRFVVTANIP